MTTSYKRTNPNPISYDQDNELSFGMHCNALIIGVSAGVALSLGGVAMFCAGLCGNPILLLVGLVVLGAGISLLIGCGLGLGGAIEDKFYGVNPAP
jgi:uncharacterized membrane protein YczE